MITRENYIEYYVDYIDGTLSPELKTEMELFLSQNLDIQEELEGIADMRLEPRSEHFSAKEDLKQTPELPNINLENSDNYLVRKVEDDLSKEELLSLDQLLAFHPELIASLNQIERTKLPVNMLEQADKASLYQIDGAHDFTYLCIAELEGDLDDESTRAFFHFIEQHPGASQVYNQYASVILKPSAVLYEHKSSLKQSETPIIPLWIRYASSVAAIFLLGFFVWQSIPIRDSGSSSNYKARLSEFKIETNSASESNLELALQELLSVSQDSKDTLDDGQEIVMPERAENNDFIAREENQILPQNKVIEPVDIIAHEINQLKIKDTVIMKQIRPQVLQNIDDDEIADNSVAPKSNLFKPESSLKPKELIARTISRGVNKEEADPNYETDMNYAAVTSLAKLTNSQAAYEKQEDDKRAITEFSLGRFSFYRNKKK